MKIRFPALLCAVLLLPLAAPASAQGPSNPAAMNERAPATYKVRFDTSKGSFVIEVVRDWAPNGADRFYNLVNSGFFDDGRFFRVVKNFMVQFGINGDPAVNAKMREARIKDDPVKQSNRRSYITYATSGPNSRTSQVFINTKDNGGLDSQGFSPFGRVITGMNVVDALNGEYGDGPPAGPGPNQSRIQAQGNAYLKAEFPNLDFVKKATIEK
jgi:peptidyl-prolyl cis-trans isomerase A (cyclophilin A)